MPHAAWHTGFGFDPRTGMKLFNPTGAGASVPSSLPFSPGGDSTGFGTNPFDQEVFRRIAGGESSADIFYKQIDPNYGTRPPLDRGNVGQLPSDVNRTGFNPATGFFPNGVPTPGRTDSGAERGALPSGGPNRAVAQLRSSPQASSPQSSLPEGQRIGAQLGFQPGTAGGVLTGPEDVQFLLDQGLISQDQANVLFQVAQQNQAATGPGSNAASTGFRPSGDTEPQPAGGGGGAGGGQVPFQGPSGGVQPGGRLPNVVNPQQPAGAVPGNFFPPGTFQPPQSEFGQPETTSPFNSRTTAQGLLGPFGGLVPGFENLIPPGYAGFLPDERSNFFNLAAGIFGNDPAGLGGVAGPNLFGTAANLTLGEALRQEQLNNQALSGLGQQVGMLQNSPASTGTTGVLGGLAQNPFTTSSDALQGEIEGLLTRRLGTAAEGTTAALRDSQAARGVGGGESALIRSGADFGNRATLANALAEARIGQAQRRQQDLQNAIAMFGQGANTLSTTNLGPQVLLSQAQAGRTNPYTGSLIQQIRDLGGLGLEDELREAYTSFGNLPSILQGVGALGSSLFGTQGAYNSLFPKGG